MSLRTRAPWFAIFVTLVTVTFEAATHFDHTLYPALVKHFALDWDALARFELYRIVVSPFVQTSPGFSPTIIGLTTLAVPLYELRDGSKRAVALFFAGDWMSTLPIVLLLRTAGWLGSATASRLSAAPDSGSSSGGFACMAAFCCALPLRWRAAGLLGMGGFFAVRVLFWHRLFDFQHLTAAVAGVVIWHVLERRWAWRGARPTPETGLALPPIQERGT